VRLGQDRLSDVLESGTVRILQVPRVEQRGKVNHRVNPGGEGGKYMEGRDASGALGVEKLVAEEPSGQRFLTWVVRHPSWPCNWDIHLVEKTGVFRP